LIRLVLSITLPSAASQLLPSSCKKKNDDESADNFVRGLFSTCGVIIGSKPSSERVVVEGAVTVNKLRPSLNMVGDGCDGD
jgi:hypothetical protein